MINNDVKFSYTNGDYEDQTIPFAELSFEKQNRVRPPAGFNFERGL